jgi:hypothetical protein
MRAAARIASLLSGSRCPRDCRKLLILLARRRSRSLHVREPSTWVNRSRHSPCFSGRYLEPSSEFFCASEDLERTAGQAVDLAPTFAPALLTALPSVDLRVDPTSEVDEENALVAVQVEIFHCLCPRFWDSVGKAKHARVVIIIDVNQYHLDFTKLICSFQDFYLSSLLQSS